MEFKYKVTRQMDGQDCDGPISHTPEEFELNHTELAQMIGLAFLRHGTASIYDQPNGDYTGEQASMVFSNQHDEGFSRTTIDFREIETTESEG